MKETNKNTHPEILPAPDELFHNHSETLEDESIDYKYIEPPGSNVMVPDYITNKRAWHPLVGGMILVCLLVLFTNLMGIRFFSMSTNSMESVIPTGSLLITKSVSPETLLEGDIITFYNADGLSITHKIRYILPNYQNSGKAAFATQGVENESLDREIVMPDQVLGKVIFHIPRLGSMLMSIRAVLGIR